MSIRHLDSMFDPHSVAVLGASDRPGRVGSTVWHNLRAGGYAGQRWAVNPAHGVIDGETVFPNVESLPQAPELAVICTPPATVPGLIEALGARGTRAAVVLSAGFSAEQKQALQAAARKHLLRVLGPNCLGLINGHARLNASFSHCGVQPGGLAFVSQSGALMTAVLDWAREREIGFSHCVSLGEHADVDFGDMLDWLASDARTRAILLYIESVDSARKFMSAARAAARNKPVLVVKAGRSTAGQAAASSHTGAMAGSDQVYDAAIRRAGMLRVNTLQDLFVAAETLARFRHLPSEAEAPQLEQLTIVTNGGGAGVMAADAAAAAGLALAPLGEATRAALDAVLPAHWSRGNPVDIIGDAPVERYAQTLRTLLAQPASGTLLFMHAPTAIVPSLQIAEALVPIVQATPGRVLSAWLGGPAVAQARHAFNAAGIAVHDTPEEAVQAFSLLVDYRRNQQLLLQTPTAQGGADGLNLATVTGLVDNALAAGQTWLTEPEAKALLAACGVPVVRTLVVGNDAEQAVAAAAELGYPVVLKLLSPQVTHKSDVGGVVLDIEHEAALRAAVAQVLSRVQRLRPDAQVAGFTVQAMVRKPRAIELIVGATVDPLFGPVLLFGQGGTAVEVLADRAVGLPPLNRPLALALIARTRVARLLAGWRDVPAADMDALVRVLTALSALLAAEPRIAEIDINPLLADATGVVALDARIRVSADAPGGTGHFAILPYPAELSECTHWRGHRLSLRPIRPEDEPQHRAFLAALDPEDIRMRVFYSRRSIEHSELARLTQIDYEREMAFVATVCNAAGAEDTWGVARAYCDPDNQEAEFAVLVRSDLKGQGLGEVLMNKLVAYLRAHGTRRIVGSVLAENQRMLGLASSLGFSVEIDAASPDLRSLRMTLN